MSGRVSIHALAWLAWLAATMVILTITRNPIYLGLVLGWIGMTHAAVRYRLADQAAPLIISPLRFGLFVVVVSALFNGLTVHVGATVLFTLPAAIPFFGGPVTLEALIYGALNGAAIAGLFAAFAVINRVVPVRSLIRVIPRAYYSVAVVASIAITYVPTTRRQFQQIREAQAIRGHRMRGVRSWLPLALPLLTGGLERALQLAEAMMARGFAGGEPRPGRGHARGDAAGTGGVGNRLAAAAGLAAGDCRRLAHGGRCGAHAGRAMGGWPASPPHGLSTGAVDADKLAGRDWRAAGNCAICDPAASIRPHFYLLLSLSRA